MPNQTIIIPLPDLPKPFKDGEGIIGAIILIGKALLQICHSVAKLMLSITTYFLSFLHIGKPPIMLTGILDILILLGFLYHFYKNLKGLLKYFVMLLILIIIISIGYNALI